MGSYDCKAVETDTVVQYGHGNTTFSLMTCKSVGKQLVCTSFFKDDKYHIICQLSRSL